MKKLKNIQSAVGLNGGGCNISLDQPWLGTAKIGQILPIYHEALIPGDHVRVNTSVFSRFAPLAVPSYVNLTLRTMTVFVPYHQLADGCESFFQNQKYFHGMNNVIPKIKFSEISALLNNSYYSTSTGASATSFDVCAVISATPWSYKRYTPLGMYAVKLLRSLGYNVGKYIMGDSSAAASRLEFEMNALPLLAFAHGYNNYMSYSPQQNTSALTLLLESIKRSSSSTGYSLTWQNLDTIIKSILLTYDDALPTMAWADTYSNQGSNLSTVFHQTSGLDTAGDLSVSSYDSIDVSAADGSLINEGDGAFNAAQIRLVMKYDDYFRRSMFGGSKDVEQIYSRLGVKIDDFRCRYPYFLRETSSPVSIGDVTSTSDTAVSSGGNVTGGALGSYAGKAINDGGTSIDFDCKDYGMLITYAWYAPTVLYIDGYDKEVLRINSLDFYQPELDQGFASTLQRREVCGNDYETSISPLSDTFGVVPLYSQYLFGKQYVVGDFRIFDAFNSWHFGRDLASSFSVNAQDTGLIYMPQTGTAYERIFNVVDPSLVNADTIYMDVHNDVKAHRPMKNYTGKVGLGDGDIDVGLNGSQLN